jgi:RNA polymerase sigma-70 factor (ECF subfamily)
MLPAFFFIFMIFSITLVPNQEAVMMRNFSLYDQKVLFRSIADGDVTAFRVLFEAYNKRLYGAALKITKSTYAAEEIVQEVFTCLWESRSCLANVDNPPAYIFTVAYRKTFRYLKMVAADTKLLQSLQGRINEVHNETEEWLEVNETREFIDSAVNELPPQRRLIYKLSRENGFSHKEIAEQLHISSLTVKKQLQLALRHIHSSLARIAPLLALFFLPSRF